MRLPPPPCSVRKRGSLLLPDGQRLHFTITDEVSTPQSELPSKIIFLQRIEFDDGKLEVRLGYYIIGKKPRMRGKWVWGQYATLMPLSDFEAVIKMARKKGWIRC